MGNIVHTSVLCGIVKKKDRIAIQHFYGGKEIQNILSHTT